MIREPQWTRSGHRDEARQGALRWSVAGLVVLGIVLSLTSTNLTWPAGATAAAAIAALASLLVGRRVREEAGTEQVSR